MTGVFAGHEHASRRRANRIAAVMVGKSHAFPGKLIEMRRLDLLLPIAAEFGVTEIVGEDEDDEA